MTRSNEHSNTLHDATVMLKAIGNTHRLLTLCALAEGPLAVCDLNRRVPITQSALSQHLARLRSAGLVVTERDGPRTLYALADARSRRLIEVLCTEYQIPHCVPNPTVAAAARIHADPAVTADAPARL